MARIFGREIRNPFRSRSKTAEGELETSKLKSFVSLFRSHKEEPVTETAPITTLPDPDTKRTVGEFLDYLKNERGCTS